MNLTRHTRTATACLLLILFMGLWASSNLFIHTHIVNSQLVTHSHPFSHKTTHSHSGAELNLLAAYARLAFLSCGLSLLALPAVRKNKLLYCSTLKNQTSYYGTCRCLRAPPVNL